MALNKFKVRLKGERGEITVEHEHDLNDVKSIVLDLLIKHAVAGYNKMKALD